METAGQLAVLESLGCRFLQGYLLGRPVPPQQLLEVVNGFDPSLLDTADQPAGPTSGDVDVHTVGRGI